ncbi:DMT family transporter [Pseudomonas putida]|uniref:DMT family transporter n=1 Tax=Pseudomonas putida TaxID=303 RepID=UPI002363BC5E|nr:DMT family transporter [Pseudomonas putida]MDD2153404.1 DMT family transporter [Pseudomonas putida]
MTALIATSIPVAGAATGPRNALCVAHLAAVLFGLTGILGHLIEADASIITFGRATFAFTGLGNTSLGSNDWINLALLGVFCTGLSHDLFVKSLEGLEARTAGMIIALEPVYAILGAWWLFGDQPTLRMAAGAGLIVLRPFWRQHARHR